MPGFNTPVLFLIFNRPEETRLVFEQIRRARPQQLFIAADGPRLDRPGEAEQCQQTREITAGIDWTCQVKTLFRDSNLGCGRAVSEAISWFFDEVEEGIILEDDCLPHPDFFPFCAQLLDRYRDNPQVATISGTHCLPASLTYQHSHYFSKYFQMWGWASWRRTWQHYDFTLSSLDESGWLAVLQRRHPITFEVRFWQEILSSLKAGITDTWDFQVFFSCWKTGGNHALPRHNLISNLGYGANATHTNFESTMSRRPTQALTLDQRPVPAQPDPQLDNLIFYTRYLDSMTHTWLVEQALSPDRQLGQLREELALRKKDIQALETRLRERSAQLVAAMRPSTPDLSPPRVSKLPAWWQALWPQRPKPHSSQPLLDRNPPPLSSPQHRDT